MEDLFSREQLILEGALKHLDKLCNGGSYSNNVYANLVTEYGIILKQLRKVVKISDKASGVLINDQKFSQEKINKLENELLQSQISIMLSQIQPHFLFNSLVAIQELCRLDPEAASEAVGDFSTYLRGNLDSLLIKIPIPFDRELRHVEAYLSLEQRRFGEKLRVVFNISTRYFLIPTLTLQPLVENAVRHGVTKRENGGSVTINVDETDTEIIISVVDNGVGFDTSKAATIGSNNDFSTYNKRAHTHIGIENVRSRLISMCAGNLHIQSEPGAGTTAVINLPKISV